MFVLLMFVEEWGSEPVDLICNQNFSAQDSDSVSSRFVKFAYGSSCTIAFRDNKFSQS